MARGSNSNKPAKKPSTRQPGVIGFAWYRREEWDRIKSAVADPEVFEQSFDQWEVNATAVLRNLRSQGYRVSKVDVALSELQAWCRKHNRPLDGAARGEFATRQLPGMVHDRALPRPAATNESPVPTEPGSPGATSA